ncbi:MAG TPA: amidohydrolase [Thermomicrobiales bacterium]|nr:amidohydrolase [Thermomicrobiales bacterium]
MEEREGRFVGIANQIWENPEVALKESFAAKLQADDLAADGFTITFGLGDLPTAFKAEWTNGEGGPIIGFLGEYDALPGLSQERSDIQTPIVADGPGHGCGHNLLGTAALAAASVVKAWLQATNTPGTVRYYGCPAEETGEGKSFMARAGAFDGLDLALTWHPGSTTVAWEMSTLASSKLKYRFKGRTAHAAANPETGRSALDAVELMNVGVNFLREHMPDRARIHYVITNGGGAPNVVPDDCEVWYFVRSPERHQVDELIERVNNIARGAAMMTETQVEINFLAGSYNYLPNHVVTEHIADVLQELGPITFTDEEYDFAKTIAGAFPESLRESLAKADDVPANRIGEGLITDVYPLSGAGEVMSGSTDVSDVSWNAPTAQIMTTCFVVGVPGHSWAITATSGMSIGHKGMLHAAKAMAITAADAIANPEILAKAKAEFDAATAGRPFKTPIPAHIMPRKP